jgi:hypothetical protein
LGEETNKPSWESFRHYALVFTIIGRIKKIPREIRCVTIECNLPLAMRYNEAAL